jgi:methyltransferase (TIGR00027 family)
VNPDRASRTALLIGRSLAFTSEDPTFAAFIPLESAALARAALAIDSRRAERILRMLSRPGLRWIVLAAEAAVLPGIQLHYALRKRFIDEVADRAIEAGVRQVVVIGAGFDSLALRLSRRPEEIVSIEVDHPATQDVKRRALAAIATSAGDLRLVAADLAAEALPDALSRARYDPTLKTLFVAEGLTMYLREEEVRALLGTFAHHAPSDSRFVWTFMEPMGDGRIAFHGSKRAFVDRWLRSRDEPFTWGIAPDRIEGFVREIGLELVRIAGAGDLRTHYLAPNGIEAPLAVGEHLCVVRRP